MKTNIKIHQRNIIWQIWIEWSPTSFYYVLRCALQAFWCGSIFTHTHTRMHGAVHNLILLVSCISFVFGWFFKVHNIKHHWIEYCWILKAITACELCAYFTIQTAALLTHTHWQHVRSLVSIQWEEEKESEGSVSSHRTKAYWTWPPDYISSVLHRQIYVYIYYKCVYEHVCSSLCWCCYCYCCFFSSQYLVSIRAKISAYVYTVWVYAYVCVCEYTLCTVWM